MKAMSDNEFDKAFKSSFEDFEVAPSTKSWGNISAQLNQKPKGKIFSAFWLSVAASVVIVISIGTIIYLKPMEETIRLRANQPKDSTLLSNNTTTQLTNNNTKKEDIPLQEAISDGQINYFKKDISVTKTKEDNLVNKNTVEDATISDKYNVSIVNKVEEILVNTKPIKKIKSVAQQTIIDKESSNIGTQTAIVRNSNDDNLSNESVKSDRKLKIKSVGDLVNFVIAKVDKREEKIIKVSKTEESDTEITGINLGLFKFRKAEK